MTPRKITVATVATVADSARKFDSIHIILCLAEVSILIVKHDVLPGHPRPQGLLAVALLAAAEPHGAVLLAGESVGHLVGQLRRHSHAAVFLKW